MTDMVEVMSLLAWGGGVDFDSLHTVSPKLGDYRSVALI